jgi:hypothetical protein
MFSEYDRRVLKMRLRQLFGRRPSGPRVGPRIAVVANCQTFGIAYAMDMLVEGATVEPIQILLDNRTTPDLLARVLCDYDYVFGLRHISGQLRGSDSVALERLLPQTHWFPLFYFGGFHPDFLLNLQAEGAQRPIRNLFGIAHSAIVATAFRLGLSQSAASALLHEDVFEALGYFDVWQASWDEMLRVGREYDLDFSADMVRWMRTGCFMHTPIHPKAHVMFDIARQLLKKAGVATRDVEFPHYAVDRLADDVVLPVYPAIAQRLGLKGDDVFKRASHPGPKNKPYFYALEDFVAISYESYVKAGAAAVSHPRIEGWLKSPEICDLFRSGAKRRADNISTLGAEDDRHRKAQSLVGD